MKVYTFDDWLNDLITERSPFPDTLGGKDYPPMPINILYHRSLVPKEQQDEMPEEYGIISKETFDKIIKCQKEAFSIAVEMNFESRVKKFTELYNSSPYKEDYLNNEIVRIKEIVNKDPNELNHVLAGLNNFITITGRQYKDITSSYRIFKKGKIQYMPCDYNNNMKIAGLYKYLKFLENELEKQNTIPNKVLAIYIKAKQEMNLLPKKLSSEKLQEIKNKVSSTSSIASIRGDLSNCGTRKERIDYLNKEIHCDFTKNGYDILRSMPKGDNVIKYIQNNW